MFELARARNIISLLGVPVVWYLIGYVKDEGWNLADCLEGARASAGLTQDELARRAGTSRTTLSAYGRAAQIDAAFDSGTLAAMIATLDRFADDEIPVPEGSSSRRTKGLLLGMAIRADEAKRRLASVPGGRPCRTISRSSATWPTSDPLWSVLVISVSQASRAELVVFLHNLLKFVPRAADHLVLIVVVLERAACGPVQDSLIKLAELRFGIPMYSADPSGWRFTCPGPKIRSGKASMSTEPSGRRGMSAGLSGSLTAMTYTSGWPDRYSAGAGPPKWRSI